MLYIEVLYYIKIVNLLYWKSIDNCFSR